LLADFGLLDCRAQDGSPQEVGDGQVVWQFDWLLCSHL